MEGRFYKPIIYQSKILSVEMFLISDYCLVQELKWMFSCFGDAGAFRSN